MLIPGEEVSRVVLPGFEITMPASKNKLGLALGELIFLLGRGVSRVPLRLSSPAEQGGMIRMMIHAISIVNENPDIVTRVTTPP